MLASPAKPALVEGDDDLPFSPEVGSAIPFEKGFAIGALSPIAPGLHALVILLGEGEPRRVDLGPVHGDVLPPVVAESPGALLAALPDGAPTGTIVRLARIDDLGARDPTIRWGAEIPVGHDESDAFAFDAGEKVAALVWDDWNGTHSVVRIVTASTEAAKVLGPERTLSPGADDSESPLLVRRKGGFWAAWITNEKRPEVATEVPDEAREVHAMSMGSRWVTVAPLDDAGQLSGAPTAATPRSGRVLGFDLADGLQGGALVAYRDGASSPAASGGSVRVAVVRPDGSAEQHLVSDDDVGSVTPLLLRDRGPQVKMPLILAFATDDEMTRIVPLDPAGRILGDVSTETAMGAAQPLSSSAGTLLVAGPRSGGVALDLYACESADTKAMTKP